MVASPGVILRSVLMAAGEYVSPDATPRGTEGRRYQTRLERLEAAAGDTVEIVTGNAARSRGLGGAGIYVWWRRSEECEVLT